MDQYLDPTFDLNMASDLDLSRLGPDQIEIVIN